MMDITYQARLLKAWQKRREIKGTVVTANDLWTEICRRHPDAGLAVTDRLFEGVAP